MVDLGPESVAVLSSTWRRKEVRLKIIDQAGDVHTLDPEELTTVPVTVGTVRLPVPFNPNSRSHQHDIAGQLKGARRAGKSKRAKLRLEQRNAAASKMWKGTAANDISRDLRRIEARISERRGRLTERFRAVVALLTELGYIENWTLSKNGTLLLGTFHELDLALAESIRHGYFDDHGPEGLAALVSVFVYEPRNDDAPPPWYPNAQIEAAADGIATAVAEVQRLESAYGLGESRDVAPGLIAATYGWASGGGLADVLDAEVLTPGDFVRSMRQVLDILSQLAHVAPNEQTRTTARKARGLVQRGIVDATVDDVAQDAS